MDANIERKLHDADAALLHSNDAATSGTERSSQYFLFRNVEVGSDFIFGFLPFLKIGLGARRYCRLRRLDSSNVDSRDRGYSCAPNGAIGLLGENGRKQGVDLRDDKAGLCGCQ